MRMPEGIIGKLKMLPKLAEMGAFFPKMVSEWAVQGSRPPRSLFTFSENFPFSSAGPKTEDASSHCR